MSVFPELLIFFDKCTWNLFLCKVGDVRKGNNLKMARGLSKKIYAGGKENNVTDKVGKKIMYSISS